MQKHQTIAIIGGGPRGLAVAERLGIELSRTARSSAVRVLLIDDHEPGSGRIWRRTQSDSFLMNTVAGQVTMYSGPRDEGGSRPGHGPSLYEWMRDRPEADCVPVEPNTYASRRRYGEYLCDVLHALRQGYPLPHILLPMHGMVCDVLPMQDGRYSLEFSDARPAIIADALVIATGHARALSVGSEILWQQHCQRSSRCDFRFGDSAADLGLEDVDSSATVGIIGMGLGFHDVLAVLTSGRGGRFEAGQDGLVYLPSGLEPRIVAGSRSGLPIPARGRNQKTSAATGEPAFFNHGAVEAMRALAQASRGQHSLSFREHLEPLIVAEVEHVYYAAWVRRRFGAAAAERFMRNHARDRNPHLKIPPSLLHTHGIADAPGINLSDLARPFGDTVFANPEDFRHTWRSYLSQDLQEAMIGNVDSPVKAALDVLRDMRDTLRSTVEFDGLDEDSLARAFRAEFSPLCGLLAAGPPVQRIDQLLALEAVGVLSVVGPEMEVNLDVARDCFDMRSPRVPGQQYAVTRLIDSRIPFPGLVQSRNPLLKAMMQRGLVRPYRHPHRKGLCEGGIDLLPHSFEVVYADGRANPRIFAIGIPTEVPRWFTQVGSATPGTKSRFTLDAQAVANGVLATLAQQYTPNSESELEGASS